MDPVKKFLDVKNLKKFIKLVRRLSAHPKEVAEHLNQAADFVDRQPHIDFDNIAVKTYTASSRRDSKENDAIHALGMEQLLNYPLFPVMTFMVPLQLTAPKELPVEFKVNMRALLTIDLPNRTATYVWKGCGANKTPLMIIKCKLATDPKNGRFVIDPTDDKFSEILYANVATVREVFGEGVDKEYFDSSQRLELAGIFVTNSLVDFLDSVIYTLADLHLNDYYPFSVEKAGGKGQKGAYGKGLARGKGIPRRVIYLNQQIDEYDRDRAPGEKDDLSQKRRGHARRGSWWTMRAKRFMHHPNYGKERANYRKSAWVGPEEMEYKGNIYRILTPQERQ